MMAAIKLAVNGTLMRGLALNPNLVEAGGEFLYEAVTTPNYRLWSIHDVHPAMVRVSSGGVAIALEVWQVPPAGLVQVLLQEPPGLCIGKITLNIGETVLGVLGEPFLCEGQRDISAFGGWRSYMDHRSSSAARAGLV
ncbi:MAG TPA: glutamyl-tRNA amidotransferase [Leptolyngbyaceae cyanobacterium M65_K2018_010]|nr:glutamyl-tRNA amidotransferase [Leptolyngbyaceae cyanobacterium M65_K2018_010]